MTDAQVKGHLSSELVPVPVQVPNMAPRNIGLASPDYQIWTTIDQSTEEGRALVLMAVDGPWESLEDAAGRDIRVENVLIYPASKDDPQTGETYYFDRTIMIGPDLEMYSTGSPWVKRDLARISQCYGLPPWVPARVLRVSKVAMRTVGSMLKVQDVATLERVVGKNQRSKKK